MIRILGFFLAHVMLPPDDPRIQALRQAAASAFPDDEIDVYAFASGRWFWVRNDTTRTQLVDTRGERAFEAAIAALQAMQKREQGEP